MFEAEACWLREALDRFAPERLSPLLNLGSSTAVFREQIQPWTEERLFRPLRARGVDIVHVDVRDEPGVDLRADLTDPADLPRLRALAPRAVLCCNLLEHVTQPERLARHCLDILPCGGLAFVTVPFSYPYHRDPIDTLYRPSPAELSELFVGADLLSGSNHRRRHRPTATKSAGGHGFYCATSSAFRRRSYRSNDGSDRWPSSIGCSTSTASPVPCLRKLSLATGT